MAKKLFLFITMMNMTAGMIAQHIVLNWQVLNPLKNTWMEFGEKGSVQEAFLNNGELPDPFYAKNEELYQWMENHEWQLISRFEVTDELLQKDFIELNFPNVDTYAQIYLNDIFIGETNNSFRPYVFEVKDKVKQGSNVIRINFTSPVEFHKEKYKTLKTKLPAPNDPNPIAIAPYSRKPQYQFGWDWSLRITTMGFWKEVLVKGYNSNEMLARNIQTISSTDKEALLQIQMETKHPTGQNFKWVSEKFGTFELEEGMKKFSQDVTLINPELWWPKGQGKAHLYNDKWKLTDGNGKVLDEISFRFGVRTSRLVREKDEIGESYEIHVNGRAIFCKGGDYIPQDIFPARVTRDQIKRMVEDMEKANFNMVRIWGGGYYPDDYFYELCDEKGIMVWQDFMFACAMYPGDDDFLANVKQEFDYQIPRISSHPSVVLFNGNNEVDVAWKNWGFQVKYVIYGKEADKIEQDYKRLFQNFLPERISYWSKVPYIHTSPLSNWGKDEYYDSGSQHYWGVWHGKDPIEDFGKKSGRFNAEYGFQSFPQMSVIKTFSVKEDWDLESEVMKQHQKSYVGNGMILKHAKILFGNPKTFEEFVYFSQLTQAKAVGIAVASHRAQAPRCMGTLYWQVNDCWQASSWSSIDYFGNWKPLHYQIQRDYEDIAVVEKIEELDKEKYILVNSTGKSQELDVKWTIYSLQGDILKIDSSKVESFTNNSHHLAVYTGDNKWSVLNFVIRFELFEKGIKITERDFLHLPNKVKKESKKESFNYSVDYDKQSNKGIVTIENTCFMNSTWITCTKNGVHFDRNFVHLLPGVHQFSFQTNQPISVDDIVIEHL